MASIGLNVYALSVFGENAQQINLHAVVGKKDIISIIEEYIQINACGYVDNSKRESICKFVDCEIVEEQDQEGSAYVKYLYGRIKSGNYGVETEIVNKQTGEIVHRQTPSEAGVLPFDFLAVLPAGTVYQTIFVMQTQGIYGIKTELEYGLNSYIHSKSKKLKLHLGTVYPKTYIERFLNEGILKKIRLFRYNIPIDLADRYGVIAGTRGKGAQQEIVFSSPLGFSRRKIEEIKECIRGNRTYNQIIEIDGFEYDDLKLDFKLGKKSKTISLKNMEKVVVSEDITDEVALQNGNPTKESIIPIMRETGIGYLVEMGLLAELQDVVSIPLRRYNLKTGRIEDVLENA